MQLYSCGHRENDITHMQVVFEAHNLQGLVATQPCYSKLKRYCPAGIPPLEEAHNKRYGKDPAYQAYRKNTNLLLPWPPSQEPKRA